MAATGVDIAAKARDIDRLARAYFRQSKRFFKQREIEGRRGRRIEADDFVQDVLLTIHRRNSMESAYDPARASLSKYVYKICFTVASHGTDRIEPEKLAPTPEGIEQLADKPLEPARPARLSPELEGALARLAERLQERSDRAPAMCHKGGMAEQEIAEELGVSRSTAGRALAPREERPPRRGRRRSRQAEAA